jgi:hypothetical protein
VKKFFSESYIAVNIIFAGIIVLIIIYSGIFSAQKNNHPIPSGCIVQPCASTGLSRSFSEIVRFRFESAKKFNANGIPIFLFFFIQFWLRLSFSWLYSKFLRCQKTIILTDAIFSVILFVITFRNFIFLLF